MDVAANDIIEVAILTQEAARDGWNILHYFVPTITGPAITYAQLAGALQSSVSPVITPLMPTVATFVGLTTRRVSPQPASVAFNPGNILAPGTATGDAMARQVCGAVTKQTELAGPANRGRMYVPFPTEGFNDANGNPTAAYLTILDDYANEVLTPKVVTIGTTAVTMIPGIYHREPQTISPLTGYTLRTYWTTQRRRAKVRPS
jgi:hypothetical protein